MSEFRIRVCTVAAVVGLLVGACGTTATQSPTSPAPGATTPAVAASQAAATQAAAASQAAATIAAGTPKNGGTLIVALPGDIVNTDPALNSDGVSYTVSFNCLESLLGIKVGTGSELVPVLAAALPTESADGLTYTFTLRTGVKFSDGTDFNADAVKYNFVRQQNFPPALQNTYNYYYGTLFGGYGSASNIASITTPDEQTVVFQLKHPQSNFEIAMTLPDLAIQSPTALKNGDADNPDPSKSKYAMGQGTGMVGTGPFMFKEWVPNDHITLVKNPNYWDTANAAHLDSIIFRPYSDQTAELNALQAGDVDLATLVPPSEISVVKADPTLRIVERGASCDSGQIGINQTHPPMNNLDIRMAIAYAVNKAAYIKAFYGGYAVVPDNWMPMVTQYAVPLNLPTYDPAQAKALIAKSGLTGSQLTIDLWYPSGATRAYMPDPKGLFQAISADLTAVGFKVVPHTAGWTDYLHAAVGGQAMAFILGWTCDYAGADDYLYDWIGQHTGTTPFPQFGYNSPQLWAAMDKALAATSTSDAAQSWAQAQQIIRADMPTVPLVNATPPAAEKTYVEGYVPNGAQLEQFNLVWLNK